jgi:NAD(P)-dependent dehydrogenase (short-subunit alcohol dehydrogenase family)
MTIRRTVLISGVAEGLGADIAETFAQAGHDIVGISRTDRSTEQLTQRVEQAGGRYIHIACDITQAGAASAAIAPHAADIDVLIHNAHVLDIKPFEETTSDEFENAWRVACLGAVVAVQSVVPHMAARKRGTVILTGATAGRRGAANFSAFASAKFALRGFGQSLAREYGPQGVHVAHIVLDGLIDEPQTDRRFCRSSAGRMNASAVARAYLDLSTQHPSAWTHEMDLRPFSEKF